MARESTSIAGSGINPLKKNVCVNKTTGERHLKGTAVVVLNPEDSSAGCSGLATPTTVGTTATQLPPTPLVYRRAMSICNNSNATIFIGFDPSVTTATGFPIPAGTALPLQINGQVLVWAVSAADNLDIRILELS